MKAKKKKTTGRSKRKSKEKTAKEIIGWREEVALPDLDIKKIRVKVDSGARTSAIHADKISIKKVDGKYFVFFRVFPDHKSNKKFKMVKAKLLEKRTVKSSTGTETLRPVIKTTLKLGQSSFPIELTLVKRDMMGFQMLLGREAFRRRYVVDAAKSFLAKKML